MTTEPSNTAKEALAKHRQGRLPASIVGVTKGDVAKIAAESKRLGLTDEDRIRGDFRVFLTLVWRYLGYDTPTPIQLSMAQFLQHGPERFVLMAFRGVAKSFITMAFALWTLYVDPQKKVLVVSGSKKRADAFTFQALAIINGMPLLQHLRPRPEQRQSSSMFDVGPARPDQSASFMAAGITGQIVGFRADLIVGDDVETNTNSLTVLMREKLADSIREFDAIIKPGGRVGFLGTPQTTDSIYNKLPGRGYTIQIWPARYPNAKQIRLYGDRLSPFIKNRAANDNIGKTTEPMRFPDEDLAARELSWGKSGFALQYMLDTSLSDIGKYPFKFADLMVMGLDLEKGPDSVSWGTGDHLALNLPVIGGLNGQDKVHKPAAVSESYSPWEEVRAHLDPSGEGEDETALAIAAKLNGRLFLLYCGGWLEGYSERTLKEIAAALVKYRVGRLRIESNFGGGMFKGLLLPHLTRAWAEANKHLPADKHGGTLIEEEQAARVQKELRIIEDLEPLLNSHRIVVAERVIKNDYQAVMERGEELGDTKERYSLFHQFSNLTREKDSLTHDDRIEAVGGVLGSWREEQGIAPEDQEAERERARQEELLQRFFDDADDMQGRSTPGEVIRRSAGGRRRTGW